MKIYDHQYMEFIFNEDRIDFIWKAATQDMGDDDFKYAILRYASYAMEYKVKKVLIDLTDFKFTPDEESGQDRREDITDRADRHVSQIVGFLLDHFAGVPGPAKNYVRPDDPDHEQGRESCCQNQTVPDDFANPPILICTEILGHKHTDVHRHAQRK